VKFSVPIEEALDDFELYSEKVLFAKEMNQLPMDPNLCNRMETIFSATRSFTH